MAQKTEGMEKKEAGANVLIEGHKCYRCDHEWRPYDLKELPIVCPKCKSPYWKNPRKSFEKSVK
ncbi:hypothetical protein HYY74_02910 [Candidatus Woesearchaeota archaeon]|nr:hypothetical protein [Candidatus Woesearchaeota archaeon]